jgi:hypothetical protein
MNTAKMKGSFLILIKNQPTNMHRREEAMLHILLNAVLEEREWSASLPGRFTSGETPLLPIREEAGWGTEAV